MTEIDYGHMSIMMISFAIVVFTMIGIGLYQEVHRYD